MCAREIPVAGAMPTVIRMLAALPLRAVAGESCTCTSTGRRPCVMTSTAG